MDVNGVLDHHLQPSNAKMLWKSTDDLYGFNNKNWKFSN